MALRCARAERVVGLLRQAVALDPLNEPLHARLVLALAASGHRAQALAVYDAIHARLAEDLDVPPGPELRAAHRQVTVPAARETTPGGAPAARPPWVRPAATARRSGGVRGPSRGTHPAARPASGQWADRRRGKVHRQRDSPPAASSRDSPPASGQSTGTGQLHRPRAADGSGQSTGTGQTGGTRQPHQDAGRRARTGQPTGTGQSTGTGQTGGTRQPTRTRQAGGIGQPTGIGQSTGSAAVHRGSRAADRHAAAADRSRQHTAARGRPRRHAGRDRRHRAAHRRDAAHPHRANRRRHRRRDQRHGRGRQDSLAVHWAHRVADRFPDGQLYVNLRGFDPGGSAMSPAEAVRGFLDALGVPPQRIPAGLDAQAGAVPQPARRPAGAGRAGQRPRRRAGPPAAARHARLPGRGDQPQPAHRPGRRRGRPPAHAGPAHRRRGPRAAGPPRSAPSGSRPSRTRSTRSSPRARGCRWRWPSSPPAPPPTPTSRWPPGRRAAPRPQRPGRVRRRRRRPPTCARCSPGPTARSAPTAARLFRLLGLHPGPDIAHAAAASLAGAAASTGSGRCWPS